jgi:hypothetical protein
MLDLKLDRYSSFFHHITKNVDPRRENEYHDEEMERERMNVVFLFLLL